MSQAVPKPTWPHQFYFFYIYLFIHTLGLKLSFLFLDTTGEYILDANAQILSYTPYLTGTILCFYLT